MAKRGQFKKGTYYARNRERLIRYQKDRYVTERSECSLSPWRSMLYDAKRRAMKKGFAFDLDDEWAEARWTGCCEVTGLEFRRTQHGAGAGFWSASLDRRDNSRGYTKDNSRFVLSAVNSMKGIATDDDMIEVAQAIVKSAAPKRAA